MIEVLASNPSSVSFFLRGLHVVLVSSISCSVALIPYSSAAQSYDELTSLANQLSRSQQEMQARMKGLQELIQATYAIAEASRVAAELSGPNGAQKAKALAADITPEAIKQTNDLAKESTRQESTLPLDLKKKVTECVDKLTTAARGWRDGKPAGAPQTQLSEACKDPNTLLEDLRREAEKARQEWDTCRATVVNVRQLGPDSLPVDPVGLRGKSSEDLANNLKLLRDRGGEARACVDTMASAFTKIRDAENAASAMGAALEMAAAACFASGGTGCIALAVIALLMKLFGGGDGNGDGKGPGQGAGNGPGQGPGSGPGTGTAFGGPIPGRIGVSAGPSVSPVAVGGKGPDSTGNTGSALSSRSGGQMGNFGNGTGQFSCLAVSDELKCWVPLGSPLEMATALIKINPDQTSDIAGPQDAHEELRRVIASKNAASLTICADKDLTKVQGLLVKVDAVYREVAITARGTGGELTLDYHPDKSTIPGASDEEKCRSAFKN